MENRLHLDSWWLDDGAQYWSDVMTLTELAYARFSPLTALVDSWHTLPANGQQTHWHCDRLDVGDILRTEHVPHDEASWLTRHRRYLVIASAEPTLLCVEPFTELVNALHFRRRLLDELVTFDDCVWSIVETPDQVVVG